MIHISYMAHRFGRINRQVKVWVTLLACCLGIGFVPIAQAAGESDPVSGLARLYVKKFEFIGNQVIPESQLTKIAEPYQGRWITSEGLEELRQALTRHYMSCLLYTSDAADE